MNRKTVLESRSVVLKYILKSHSCTILHMWSFVRILSTIPPKIITYILYVWIINEPMLILLIFFLYAYTLPTWNFNNNKIKNKLTSLLPSTHLARCQLEVRDWSTNSPTANALLLCWWLMICRMKRKKIEWL